MVRLYKTFLAIATSLQIVSTSSLPKENKVELPGQPLDTATRRIVEFSSDSEVKKTASLEGVELIQLSNGRYIVIGREMSPEQLLDTLSKLRGIKRIDTPKPIKIADPVQKTEPVSVSTPQVDKPLVNDPGYKYEWYLSATGAQKAWPLVTQKREIKVAVLDTGIDYNHPDLKNRISVDLGYNFIKGTKDAVDDNGHGTHVSGIIASEANNNQGIAGIAGSLKVKIIPLKVLDSKGEGQSDIIAKAIRYAVDNGADIINMSFGTNGQDTDIDSAVQYALSKGVFVVAAAGNDAANADNYTPAGDKGVFTVAAVNSNLKRAYFSNYGSSVEASSPGVSIISTIPGGKYQSWDGTSMAAPIVSGIAAILKAQKPELTPGQITSVLQNSAQKISVKARDPYIGTGVVNAYNAVKALETIK
jgi:subtilisin family serine protease